MSNRRYVGIVGSFVTAAVGAIVWFIGGSVSVGPEEWPR